VRSPSATPVMFGAAMSVKSSVVPPLFRKASAGREPEVGLGDTLRRSRHQAGNRRWSDRTNTAEAFAGPGVMTNPPSFEPGSLSRLRS